MSERTPKVSDDLRYDLAEAARAAERRNRPRALLIVSTLLFLAAGIYLIIALGNREAALTAFGQQQSRFETVRNLKPQFTAISRAGESGLIETTEPITDILSRIEGSATDAGLRDRLPIPSPRTQSDGDLNRREYDYSVRDPSLEALLDWVDLAREEVPGLKVLRLEVRPEARVWNFSITFVRWERTS